VLPAEPPSLAVARHRLERWLLDAGAGTEDLFAIMMAANEAATNAVEHAYGPERGPTFHLAASCRDATVELEVADAGHWRAPRGQQRGLGLQMIEQLMDSFEVERSGAGTRVRMRKQLTA
jgi:anti-sigma regulatory factor (Ser/Thr protein kinase)